MDPAAEHRQQLRSVSAAGLPAGLQPHDRALLPPLCLQPQLPAAHGPRGVVPGQLRREAGPCQPPPHGRLRGTGTGTAAAPCSRARDSSAAARTPGLPRPGPGPRRALARRPPCQHVAAPGHSFPRQLDATGTTPALGPGSPQQQLGSAGHRGCEAEEREESPPSPRGCGFLGSGLFVPIKHLYRNGLVGHAGRAPEPWPLLPVEAGVCWGEPVAQLGIQGIPPTVRQTPPHMTPVIAGTLGGPEHSQYKWLVQSRHSPRAV